MKRHTVLGVLAVLALLVPLAALLLSCGGGGGGSSGGGTSSATPGTSSVSVLLADGPADAYDQILITITEVSLIPEGQDGQPVVIFQNSQGVQVNLLDLRDDNFLLAVRKDVPAGTYAKIRLAISDIKAKGKPRANAPCDGQDIKLPSDKIDLVPDKPFTVSSGGNLVIQLDMDANKSLNLHEAGKSGKCIFRPVVFVDIKEAGALARRCPKIVSGSIVAFIPSSGTRTGFTLALEHGRGDLEVHVSNDTSIFDADGTFVNIGSLEAGQEVKVRGSLNESSILEASVVVVGDVLNLNGTVDSPVTNNRFSFTTANGEEIQGTYDVTIVGGETLILMDCDTEVGPDAIQAGMNAQVIGKLIGTELQAVTILLKPSEVSGEITVVTNLLNGKNVTIHQANGSDVVVFVPSNTPVYLEGDGPFPMNQLCANRDVRVLLDPKKQAQLTATVVYVEGEKQEGVVSLIDTPARTLTLIGVSQVIEVPEGADIIDMRGKDPLWVDFSKIKSSDYVVCYGWAPCSGGGDFTAVSVLITTPPTP